MLATLALRSLVLDHRAASVMLRGRVALDADGVRAALADPARPQEPAVIVATCNRLELHWIGTEATAAWWRARLDADAAALLRDLRARSAVRHLVRVAAGLESQLLGEGEILGQMRAAYALARTAGSSDARLDLILERALGGARRVRAESMLGTHGRSVSEAAVRLVAQRAEAQPAERTVLVIGAGEAARGVLEALAACWPAKVVLVNRHQERGRRLAQEFGVTDVRPWDALPAAVAEAQVAFCATAARHPVITPALLTHAPAVRRWLVDLAVPGNVDPALRTAPGVEVLDLDDLRAEGCPEAASGSVLLLAAEALVEREVRRIRAALRTRFRAEAIGTLHAIGEQVVQDEVARWQADAGVTTPEEQAAMVRLAQRVARRVLFPVSRYLRDGKPPLPPSVPAANS